MIYGLISPADRPALAARFQPRGGAVERVVRVIFPIGPGKARTRTMWRPTAATAVATLLRELTVPPHEVGVQSVMVGEPMPALVAHGQIAVLVVEGLTLEELALGVELAIAAERRREPGCDA